MDGAAGRQASGNGAALGGGFGSGLLQAAAEQQMQVQKRAHQHQQGVWSAGAVADPSALLATDAVAQVSTTVQCTSSMFTFAVHNLAACTQQALWQTFWRLRLINKAAACIVGGSLACSFPLMAMGVSTHLTSQLDAFAGYAIMGCCWARRPADFGSVCLAWSCLTE